MASGTPLNTNPALLAAEGPAEVDPRNPRRIQMAALLTVLIHALMLFMATVVVVPAFNPLDPSTGTDRTFKIQPPPTARPAVGKTPRGPDPKPTPGAPVKPPSTPTRAVERPFAAPPPNLPPPPAPQLAANPRANLAVRQTPSLLPLSPIGTRALAPVTPTEITPISPNASASGAPQPVLALPVTEPGSLASEELEPLAGGGLGLGGDQQSGVAALEETDPTALIPEEAFEIIPDGIGRIIRVSNEVLFDFDSPVIRVNAHGLLGQVAAQLRQFPQAEVTIEGHTDTFGDSEYNQRLSELRARSVADWIQRQNLSLSALNVVGFGESRPLAFPDGTVDQQAPNRRVDIRIRAREQTP